MTSTPDADERLINARDLALAALHEITPATTVGPPAGYLVEDDGSVSLRFENRLPGYPGWFWTVTVARVGGEEPTVLEAELLPGDGALVAPEWVPWAERLAEYRAHAAELAAQAKAAEVDGDSDDDADDDEADLDDVDLGDEDFLEDHDERQLHAGDVDGVDIDELDDESDEDESDDDDDSDDDDRDADEEE